MDLSNEVDHKSAAAMNLPCEVDHKSAAAMRAVQKAAQILSFVVRSERPQKSATIPPIRPIRLLPLCVRSANIRLICPIRVLVFFLKTDVDPRNPADPFSGLFLKIRLDPFNQSHPRSVLLEISKHPPDQFNPRSNLPAPGSANS